MPKFTDLKRISIHIGKIFAVMILAGITLGLVSYIIYGGDIFSRVAIFLVAMLTVGMVVAGIEIFYFIKLRRR